MGTFYNTDEVYYFNEDEFNKSNMKYELVGKGLAENDMFTQLGTTRVCTGFEKIVQSVHLILRTPVGTVFFNPEFGSKLPSLLFEPNDFALSDMIKHYAKEALEKWEKRIQVVRLDTEITEDIVYLRVTFNIKGSSSEESYVFSMNRKTPEIA